jgi:hypothetical protein
MKNKKDKFTDSEELLLRKIEKGGWGLNDFDFEN